MRVVAFRGTGLHLTRFGPHRLRAPVCSVQNRASSEESRDLFILKELHHGESNNPLKYHRFHNVTLGTKDDAIRLLRRSPAVLYCHDLLAAAGAGKDLPLRWHSMICAPSARSR